MIVTFSEERPLSGEYEEIKFGKGKDYVRVKFEDDIHVWYGLFSFEETRGELSGSNTKIVKISDNIVSILIYGLIYIFDIEKKHIVSKIKSDSMPIEDFLYSYDLTHFVCSSLLELQIYDFEGTRLYKSKRISYDGIHLERIECGLVYGRLNDLTSQSELDCGFVFDLITRVIKTEFNYLSEFNYMYLEGETANEKIESREISTYIQTHGTSYYLASLFFPAKIKQDVFVLYAFVRVPDDIVDDEQTHDDEKKRQLQLFCDNFWSIYEDPQNKNIDPVSEVMLPAVQLFHRLDIPRERIQGFLDAMWADLETKTYINYEQLQGYMYGSAEVVGLMMCQIIGYDEAQEEEVFRTARLLGEAMQYTNFLRDIKEDYVDLTRIYMPEQRLRDLGLSHCLLQDYIQGKPVDDTRKRFMAAQIVHTKNLYEEAKKGIQLLDPKGRRAVKYASRLYEGILDKIYSNEYDVFGKDAHTTKRDKICILFRRTFLG